MWIVLDELDVPKINRTLRRREEVLCRIEVRGELLMCSFCPRCNDISQCNEATYNHESGNIDTCNDVYSNPYICQYCWPDVEM